MLKNPVILLDMDGVLADFHGGVCDLYNVTLQQCLDMSPPPWEYAIEKQISEVLGHTVTAAGMWNLINHKMPGFWRHLRPYDYAQELYAALAHEYGKENIIISTSPGLNPQAFSEKVIWMKDFFNHCPTQMMVGPKKHLLANERHVLIDDSAHNISEFRKHGGKAVAFPQPWNDSEVFAETMFNHHSSIFINYIMWKVDHALLPSNNPVYQLNPYNPYKGELLPI